jgi:hypothetical protein
MTKSDVGLHQDAWNTRTWGTTMMEVLRVDRVDTGKKMVSWWPGYWRWMQTKIGLGKELSW